MRPECPHHDPIARAIHEIRPAILGVGAFSLCANLLVFVSPGFMMQVYDRVLTSRNETTLLMLSLIATALLLAYAALEKIRSLVLVRAGVRLDSILAGPAFEAALAGALRNRGGQHAHVVRDVDTVREFVSGPALVTLLDAPWAPVFLVVCFMLHPLVGLVSALGAAVLFGLAWWNERLTKTLLVGAAAHGAASHDSLASSLRNAEAIRGLGMAPAIRDLWRRRHEESLSRSVRANDVGGLILALSKFLRAVLQVGVLAVGAWLVIRQEVSGGVMFASSLIMGRALAPVEQAVAHWRSFVSARAAYERLSRAFDENPPRPATLRLPEPTGRVSVENLVVRAPGTRAPVVAGASFELSPGNVLAIVGPTGSGKSSLARAIVGAWPAAGGSIRFDGNQLEHFDPDQIGRALGYLPQDVELFAGTVAQNIARFGALEDARVVAAAEMASAHGVIQRLPAGYQTPVGEDGVALSGGQRQRVGLARAVYGDPAVLVLDEPNSNLDGEGDQALVDAIQRLRAAKRTVIVVTHKPSLLAVVDRILVMHDGKVLREGPRDLLMPLILGPNVAAAPMAAPRRAAQHG
ncbi:type I secretion system permease/ATPase [Alsobacter soli]|uniref:Type I secretion system permease/ATPase n=1 Tax=Alsobacter soli TaxID=2109933 RepID=A0A2T1HPI7_9HYPH|nr:type I secretion system permease/ATPase [Alsobacter soli]PSC03578.1 type I secretion system permease/ATPase [Alsobacter soli]